MESELEEANAIATASNHKYEDVNRKLKVFSLSNFFCFLFYIRSLKVTLNVSLNAPRSSKPRAAIWRPKFSGANYHNYRLPDLSYLIISRTIHEPLFYPEGVKTSQRTSLAKMQYFVKF